MRLRLVGPCLNAGLSTFPSRPRPPLTLRHLHAPRLSGSPDTAPTLPPRHSDTPDTSVSQEKLAVTEREQAATKQELAAFGERMAALEAALALKR